MNATSMTLSRTLLRSGLVGFFLLAIAALLVLSDYYLWQYAKGHPTLHEVCLWIAIPLALAATACLAGVMHFLETPLQRHTLPWYIRVPLKINKRVILVAQLLTTAVAIAAAVILLFGFKLP